MDYPVYKKQIYCCIWDKVLHMGHCLIVAHTTHLDWANNFSFDTLIGRHMLYAIMGRESDDRTLLHKLPGSHVVYGTHTWPHPSWVE